MSDFKKLLTSLHEKAVTEHDQVINLKKLMIEYFQIEPYFERLYTKVLFYVDWVEQYGQKFGITSRQNTGIDLVAVTVKGEEQFHAIQCQNYDENYTIQKRDIESFFTESEKVYFKQRIIVSTTLASWSKNAEDVLKKQKSPIIKITLQDLENSSIDWSKYLEFGKLWRKSKRGVRSHQKKAVNDVLAGLKFADRGKLIMACGTGKTFTSLKIAETLAGQGKRVLFLVPSLSLLTQTLREWNREAEIPLQSFAVCSDNTIAKNDQYSEARYLAYPATTNASDLREEMALRHSDSAMTVVFSTYHSINVIRNAQYNRDNPIPAFDLIICDEAHRTTGFTYDGEEDSVFVRVHSNDYVIAKKRLYMTATPRIYGENSKSRDDVELYSMDDPLWYGETLHTLTFSEAVSLGLLVDYKVIILAVDESHIKQSVLLDINNDIQIDDAAKIIGCWKALSKYHSVERATDSFSPMRRAVAFCQVIKEQPKTRLKSLLSNVHDGKAPHRVSSKLIAKHFQNVVEIYQKREQQNIFRKNPGALLNPALSMTFEVKHVDGSMSTREKEGCLEWFKEGIHAHKNCCKILSNVRCLSEGIDVPALDAVIFLTSRASKVDVVQAVGRVMRQAPNKQLGYVILPVVIRTGSNPDKILNDNSYKIVWQVLNALRAHDDRFDTTINKIELNGHAQDRIEIIAVTEDISQKNTEYQNGLNHSKSLGNHEITSTFGQSVLDIFYMEKVERAIFSKIVEKCGNKHYWEGWAKDIARIAESHIDSINAILEDKENTEEINIFNNFAKKLRAALNDSVSDTEIIEMLAQHLITKPVFDVLFEEYKFTQFNSVSIAMQCVVNKLSKHDLDKEHDSLQGFYASVKHRAKGIDSAEGKQKIVVELYDHFFRKAFPKMAERLGIVYTPVEVVDFILHSVEHILKTELGSSLADDNVHILDPFTGTGTFIVRLLQSGIIPRNKLLQKYKYEIYANEIVLLAYYIAAINIETVYHSLFSKIVSSQNKSNLQSRAYEPFKGICLTDTFQLDGKKDFIDKVLVGNRGRLKRQHSFPIVVIVGNPPYSVGQKNENDSNKNIKYPHLDERIRKTYVQYSSATLQRQLYDSYVRAIRWASDCIKECGVIGFVTNASFIDARTMDGLRKCLVNEFSSLYIFHLRGNCNTSGEKRKKENGNIFGSGSRAPIAISILVKNPDEKQQGKIYFKDIGDYLSCQQKLDILFKSKSIAAIKDWKKIIPDQFNDWVSQRDLNFDKYIGLGDKKDKLSATIFENYSQGIMTTRDAWCYNFSQKKLRNNMKRMVNFYHSELKRMKSDNLSVSEKTFDQTVSLDSSNINWSRGLKKAFVKGIQHQYDNTREVKGIYRPFTKQMLYFDKNFNEVQYQMPKIFPNGGGGNIVIVTAGKGTLGAFSSLIVDMVPDYGLISSCQCFPLYLYERAESLEKLSLVSRDKTVDYLRREAITDQALKYFEGVYSGETISKEDIFYYIYGLLHSKDYRERYADNLGKQIPRIPCVRSFADFTTFMQAGRNLAALHLNYETVPLYTKVNLISKIKNLKLTEQRVTGGDDTDFYVKEMKFEKKKYLEDRKIMNDKSTVIYNSKIIIENIPEDVYNYIINGKPALEWVMDRQVITTNKDSMITNDANDWAVEVMGNARYPLELFLRVITVSLETCNIVNNLPRLDIKSYDYVA
ncbi:DEAD/DEAH box helicase [Bartonella sp. CB189]|uniref:DEAD/DEAH box helicase n=1 Tax=Bartonella sp. CB189 TaxID=3112254 RepID=UPI002F96873D